MLFVGIDVCFERRGGEGSYPSGYRFSVLQYKISIFFALRALKFVKSFIGHPHESAFRPKRGVNNGNILFEDLDIGAARFPHESALRPKRGVNKGNILFEDLT